MLLGVCVGAGSRGGFANTGSTEGTESTFGAGLWGPICPSPGGLRKQPPRSAFSNTQTNRFNRNFRKSNLRTRQINTKFNLKAQNIYRKFT